MEKQLVFNTLVGLAQSNLSEGREVVISALISLIEEYNICATHDLSMLLALAVWKEATNSGF